MLIDLVVECLISRINEDKIISVFRELVEILLQEVSSFLNIKFISNSIDFYYGSFRLSFVEHSIENIIIRSTLTGMVS